MTHFSERDLQLYKSGDTGNCLGGDLYNETVGLSMHSLFNMFSSTERKLGKTKYRCVYLKNIHATETCLNPKAFIPANTENSNTEIAVGFDKGSGIGDGISSGRAPEILDETVTPPNVTFTTGTEVKDASALGGDIPPGDVAALWFRVTIAPETEQAPRDGAVLYLELGNEPDHLTEAALPTDVDEAITGETDENDNTTDILIRIKQRKPHFFICTGNITSSSSASSWINLLGILKDITKLSFGSHDALTTQMKNQIIAALSPTTPLIKDGYHYRVRNNLYEIFMDVTQTFTNPSKQYDFVLQHLKAARNLPAIDFIVVYCNKAFYATLASNDSSQKIDDKLRRTYHSLFIEYGVHLVISAQFRNYQRQHVLGYNSSSTDSPSTFFTGQMPNYVISTGQKYFGAGTGCLFVSVGTGGRRPFHTCGSLKSYTAFAHVPTSSGSAGYLVLRVTMRRPNQPPTLTGRYYEYYLPSQTTSSQYANTKIEVLRDQFSIRLS